VLLSAEKWRTKAFYDAPNARRGRFMLDADERAEARTQDRRSVAMRRGTRAIRPMMPQGTMTLSKRRKADVAGPLG
jgi:hypothetical protein